MLPLSLDEYVALLADELLPPEEKDGRRLVSAREVRRGGVAALESNGEDLGRALQSSEGDLGRASTTGGGANTVVLQLCRLGGSVSGSGEVLCLGTLCFKALAGCTSMGDTVSRRWRGRSESSSEGLEGGPWVRAAEVERALAGEAGLSAARAEEGVSGDAQRCASNSWLNETSSAGRAVEGTSGAEEVGRT